MFYCIGVISSIPICFLLDTLLVFLVHLLSENLPVLGSVTGSSAGLSVSVLQMFRVVVRACNYTFPMFPNLFDVSKWPVVGDFNETNFGSFST